MRRTSSPAWTMAPANRSGLSAMAFGPPGSPQLAVVGKLEREGGNRPRRQYGADQIGQRLVAVEDVQQITAG